MAESQMQEFEAAAGDMTAPSAFASAGALASGSAFREDART